MKPEWATEYTNQRVKKMSLFDMIIDPEAESKIIAFLMVLLDVLI
jgi:hypothetical protein